jgi:hypothetical protein
MVPLHKISGGANAQIIGMRESCRNSGIAAMAKRESFYLRYPFGIDDSDSAERMPSGALRIVVHFL